MQQSSDKNIRVQYYALLREESGRSAEDLCTPARTTGELYEQLKARYKFSLGADRLSVAVNDEFAGWDHPLGANDVVVFIPPVAGG